MDSYLPVSYPINVSFTPYALLCPHSCCYLIWNPCNLINYVGNYTYMWQTNHDHILTCSWIYWLRNSAEWSFRSHFCINNIFNGTPRKKLPALTKNLKKKVMDISIFFTDQRFTSQITTENLMVYLMMNKQTRIRRWLWTHKNLPIWSFLPSQTAFPTAPLLASKAGNVDLFL